MLDRVLRFSDLETKVRQIVERARVDYADFLSSGRITDELVESALRLAQVDPIFRAKVVDKNLGDVHKEDMEDLSKLISLIDLQFFKAYSPLPAKSYLWRGLFACWGRRCRSGN